MLVNVNLASLLKTRNFHSKSQYQCDDVQAGITMRDVVVEPQEMLALYSSEAQLGRGHTVMLSSLQCQNQNIFIIVETTCPLHRVQQPQVTQEQGEQVRVELYYN